MNEEHNNSTSEAEVSLKGSCCCGAVQFEVLETPKMMGACYCTRCRKVGASPMVFAQEQAFRLTKGEDHIAVYPAPEGYKYNRTFCKTCGTSLGEIGGGLESFPIPANCFDDPLPLSMGFHEFTSEKPEWIKICDKAPQFEGHPPSGE